MAGANAGETVEEGVSCGETKEPGAAARRNTEGAPFRQEAVRRTRPPATAAR